MDMEAAAVFVKNLLESTEYFLFLKKKVVFLILYSVSLVLILSSPNAVSVGKWHCLKSLSFVLYCLQ